MGGPTERNGPYLTCVKPSWKITLIIFNGTLTKIT